MSKHEIPDDEGDPQIPPFPESLRRKLEQQASGETPVYRVGRDGTGHLESADQLFGQDVSGDLAPMLGGIYTMAKELVDAVESIPDIMVDGETIPAEKLDLSTRLALVHAGNSIDYALRRVEDIGRTARIAKLRHELAQEMKAAGLEGDPYGGMRPAQ